MKYTTEHADFKTKQEAAKSQFCLEYLKILGSKPTVLKKVDELYLGLFNITKKENEATWVTIATVVTIPPVLTQSLSLNCSCYMIRSNDNQFVERIAKIYVRQNGEHGSVIGCNFNEQAKSLFNSLTYSHQNKVRNVEKFSAGKNLALLCPKGYTVEPSNCFENMYTYKNMAYALDDTVSSDNIENVTAATIWGNEKTFDKMVGDARFKYATIPSDITAEKKGVFTCLCKREANIYRMNILLNKSEEEFRAEVKKAKETNSNNNSGNSNSTSGNNNNASNTSVHQSISLVIVSVFLSVLFFH